MKTDPYNILTLKTR